MIARWRRTGANLLPKAVLHDHLDGGLRVDTVMELANESGYDMLPTHDQAELQEWFDQGRSGSLDGYLDAFQHTVGVMQTPDAIERVAFEAVADHAAAGVIYCELRFAPSLHCRGGMDRREAVEAALAGMARASAATGVVTALIVVAMREASDSVEVARLAVAMMSEGVDGFDLAGPELGYPLGAHAAACRVVTDAGLSLTLHAGEGDGPSSIVVALDQGAQRIGQGVRVVEDCRVVDGEIVDLGPIAERVHSGQIPLEICVTSNVHTGIAETAADHPIGMLYRAGFAVTINTDNRLMSRTDMQREFGLLATHHGFGADDFASVTDRALAVGFGDGAVRNRLRRENALAGYAGDD